MRVLANMLPSHGTWEGIDLTWPPKSQTTAEPSTAAYRSPQRHTTDASTCGQGEVRFQVRAMPAH
eukprot:6185827-Pleurochrysis_carterae.AAC.2